MNKIFFGFLFVFFKTNTSFFEDGTAFYGTNLVGYSLIYFGVKELGMKNESILKTQPYVIFMIVHSILFLGLNGSGNSPLSMALDSYMAAIALVGTGFVIAGMFMVFVIISFLLEGLGDEFSTRRLSILCAAMMTIFTLAGLFYFFSPEIAQLLVSVLLLLKVMFLVGFYTVILGNRESIAGQDLKG
ncbi:hypothetical protein P6709_09855 [Jeotgalibacillus sp. ET6]|uniref:hypothetical protein n=1 Tax=Jeotgalibacillus sp. ET6 TaxID=3037260 RepID=UPI002418B698|nr:hypothetical protein [Jeotgalibacillus sp. ET6]MDG5472055.1 hypothetical protein [Jeotgalibacillus sp. ET6]